MKQIKLPSGRDVYNNNLEAIILPGQVDLSRCNSLYLKVSRRDIDEVDNPDKPFDFDTLRLRTGNITFEDKVYTMNGVFLSRKSMMDFDTEDNLNLTIDNEDIREVQPVITGQPGIYELDVTIMKNFIRTGKPVLITLERPEGTYLNVELLIDE